MPTYEYECKDCGNVFERFESITAGNVKKCPECGNKATRIIGAGSAIIFKGSGFYQTDYRSKEYNQQKAKAEKGKSTDKGKTAEKKKSPKKDSNTP
ncbi:MAG: zinc ribbon domain-containing protein [Candidatus Brocadiales bacterium]